MSNEGMPARHSKAKAGLNDWMIDWVIECLLDGDRRVCPPKRSGGGIE